ncbi:hypothetical protein FVQ98_04365 [Ottowia sp. GY511]|uniref:SMI1/KNR4 family protein n=1 Tax=Ottowia flava TaxID=2675430 RepID=A0ABW4KW08_9BURK|nr:hypothetical protein [Ottowia sp. GY511]TXK31220.1 hypothetical protein FVQ98_04365 [Ottowia sp. GY511]
MSQFNDLIAEKGTGTACDQLTPLTGEALASLQRDEPGLPAGYVDFLSHVGFGPIGDDSFMLYSGLLAPEELYGQTPPGLAAVQLFGDDFAGYASGFDTANGWRIVEIDPTSHEATEVARDFAAFIRLKIAAAS